MAQTGDSPLPPLPLGSARQDSGIKNPTAAPHQLLGVFQSKPITQDRAGDTRRDEHRSQGWQEFTIYQNAWKAHRNRAEPSPDQEAVLMWSKFPLQQLQKKSRRLRHSQMDPPEQLHLLELFA